MFYYIEGKLAHADYTFAVIDAGGVGYKLTISQTTYESLPPHLSVKEAPTVRLYSYMAVREDGIELFGFYSTQELDAFKLLITVSGVGPKAAISILSILSPEKFALAVANEDTKAISKANGIGAKTAARIVLELKDKVAKCVSYDTEDGLSSAVQGKNDAAATNKLSEAQNALLVLGYTKSEILTALRDVDISQHEIEDIIRLALKNLMR